MSVCVTCGLAHRQEMVRRGLKQPTPARTFAEVNIKALDRRALLEALIDMGVDMADIDDRTSDVALREWVRSLAAAGQAPAAEVAKFSAWTQANRDAIKRVGRTPAEYVRTFSEACRRNPTLTAQAFLGQR